MYSRYKHGCLQDTRIHPCASIPCISREDVPGQGAIPESVRIVQKACVDVWVQTAAPVGCVHSTQSQTSTIQSIDNGAYQKMQLPVAGLTAIPTVTVENVSESVRLSQTATQIKKNESDPYDPVTRFARYFPPAPLPYVCPERLPSNEPLPRETPCIPNTRFQGSVPGR